MTLPSPEAAAGVQLREAIRAEALRLGFSLVGFTTADPLGDAVDRRWRRWLDKDRAGRMEYLRRPEPRRTHPRDLLAEAQSVIVVAAQYYDGDHDGENEDERDGANRARDAPASLDVSAGKARAVPHNKPARGKIARYAWGRDYHGVLKEKLGELARWIERAAPHFDLAPPASWRAVTDSAPLDERSLAERAGLGFFGKNTLLLNPEIGSWFLLGELLLSIAIPPDEPVVGSCGSCRLCLDACPTGAFVGPFDLDPRRCISYLTIEQPDPIPAELARRQSGWAFGCDLCQEVCPFNEAPAPRLLSALAASEGMGRFIEREEIEATPSNKAFARKWAHTPLERAGLKGLKKNLAALAVSPEPNVAKTDIVEPGAADS